MKLRKGIVVAASAVLVLAAGCSGTGQAPTEETAGGGSGTYGYNFTVVTHGAAGDTFWDVVKKGAEKAGADEGVTVTYRDSNNDPTRQAQLIDAAINEQVDGLVVSMSNPDALQASIQKAIAAGIPVITINSGQDKSTEFGALAHVGQDEIIAGRGAGAQLKAAGVTKALCVIQEAGNIGLEQRCQGFAEGLGGTVENLQVENSNPSGAQSTLKSKLQSDPSINGILTLGPVIGSVAIKAVTEAGSQAKLATFDLNADVTQAIADGTMLFAVDQQQYTQGYLPIVMLTLYKSNLNTIGGGQPVLTGPGYVTKENAAQDKDLSAAGTR
ncbi:MAG: sugar ABC transporter substrate-binding protein [Pseudonocardia sp.]